MVFGQSQIHVNVGNALEIFSPHQGPIVQSPMHMFTLINMPRPAAFTGTGHGCEAKRWVGVSRIGAVHKLHHTFWGDFQDLSAPCNTS